jgi:hypothetical protein
MILENSVTLTSHNLVNMKTKRLHMVHGWFPSYIRGNFELFHFTFVTFRCLVVHTIGMFI